MKRACFLETNFPSRHFFAWNRVLFEVEQTNQLVAAFISQSSLDGMLGGENCASENYSSDKVVGL